MAKKAVVGNFGKGIRSDCKVTLELTDKGGIEIELLSKIELYFGDAIRTITRDELEFFNVKNAKIKIDEEFNPYRNIAKNMNIDKKINFSLWKTIFDGLLSFFNNNISLSYEKINTDKEFFIINIQK